MSNDTKTYQVFLRRCDEGGVFFVERSDVPGLHVESETIDQMVEAIDDIAPELIRCNLGFNGRVSDIRIELIDAEMKLSDLAKRQELRNPKILIDHSLLTTEI